MSEAESRLAEPYLSEPAHAVSDAADVVGSFAAAGDIPMVNGKKLDCAYCHKPDNRGAYMQPINFAANCQACHGLQIDPSLPDFQIPHPAVGGQSDTVRDFLLTLPTQYANYAVLGAADIHGNVFCSSTSSGKFPSVAGDEFFNLFGMRNTAQPRIGQRVDFWQRKFHRIRRRGIAI